ncbi:MAG: bifunctional AP-4-A phosphorylase/ADP sulfurylase [Piccolia ochrophora]|nr:MAG: bifunctional AP-4-A phosphorylase/ADP sulfurylase [Piccolia ochrophora]
MRLNLHDRLPSLVRQRYASAKTTESLIFSWTQLAVIHPPQTLPVRSLPSNCAKLRAHGWKFQLRYCPALSKKPEPQRSPEQNNRNPFQDPPLELLIAEVPARAPSHNLVLNKYPVIPHHFILATKAFKEQTSLLEEDDLAATYACLREWEKDDEDGGKLFAFFNSGEHSGASQKHRHIQFIPVNEMLKMQKNESWQLLADAVPPSSGEASTREQSKVPFLYFRTGLPAQPEPSELHKIYMQLYHQASSAVQTFNQRHPRDPVKMRAGENNAATISYNLSMTTQSMTICPRRRGSVELKVAQKGDQGDRTLGPIELNGTILAGTIMVKMAEEWDLLREEPARLTEILEALCIPARELFTEPDESL